MKIIKKINFHQVLLVVLHNIGWVRATCLLRNSITELVLQHFAGRLIPQGWPVRLPDLVCCDYFYGAI